MTCNLAISIQKARLNNDAIAKLLTPELMEGIAKTFLAAQGMEVRAQVSEAYRAHVGGLVSPKVLWLFGPNNLLIMIDGLKVQVTGGSQDQATLVAQQMTTLLERSAGKMIDIQIAKALTGLGGLTSEQRDVSDEQGMTQRATVFTLSI